MEKSLTQVNHTLDQVLESLGVIKSMVIEEPLILNFKSKQADGITTRLYKEDNIFEIWNSFFKKGSIVNKHSHQLETEIFVCVSGKLKVLVNDEPHILERGDTLRVVTQSLHSLEFLEDTILTVITIPPLVEFS